MTSCELALVIQTIMALTVLALLVREWLRQDREDSA